MKIINTSKNILKYGRFYKEAQVELDKIKILHLIQEYFNKHDHFLCILLLNFRFISVDAYKYLQDDIDRVAKLHAGDNYHRWHISGWSISGEYGSKNSLQIRQLWVACQIRIAEDKLNAYEEA